MSLHPAHGPIKLAQRSTTHMVICQTCVLYGPTMTGPGTKIGEAHEFQEMSKR